ncbi:hypothetical protein CYG49_01705 [Candidatus Saccharibacteria bacterium]|nr:MAG: hypothetical protein CYG49_01705 [Candidatus Saccharibacteria bacterium]
MKQYKNLLLGIALFFAGLISIIIIGNMLPAVLISDGTEDFDGQHKVYAQKALDNLKLVDRMGAYPKLKVTQVRGITNHNHDNCQFEALVQSYFLFGIKAHRWYVTDCNWHTTTDLTLPEVEASDEVRSGRNQCGAQGIIVSFRATAPKERQLEIIEAEGAKVAQEYDTLGGYALSVPTGTEAVAVEAFKSYSEVETASSNGCNSTQ